MKRVTFKTITERAKNKERDFPSLKDILVDLSVKNTDQVTRKLRLIGMPIEFMEYSDKKRVPNEKNKFFKEEFPDAEHNKRITRIGHEDRDQCPWRKMGYVGAKKYAYRCLEEQADGTWLPKVLCKGPSIVDEFANWELGQAQENDPDLCKFLGGDSAPVVRIQATKDLSKLGGVEYKVFISQKLMPLTEDHINALRASFEPSADELNKLRAEYAKDAADDEDLPEWRDYFEYGFDLGRIFKFTPPMSGKTDDAPTSQASVSDSVEPETDAEVDPEVVDDLAGVNW